MRYVDWLVSATVGKLALEADPVAFLVISNCAAQPSSAAPELLASREHEGHVFAFDVSGAEGLTSGARPIVPEAASRSLIRRLAFFSEPEHVPYLTAPVVLRDLWGENKAGSTVIAYPGVAVERLSAAQAMLERGCEAVLLRYENAPPALVALARNTRNERMLAHWVDLLDQFSSDSEPLESFDLSTGAQMVDFLCDRVGSIRANRQVHTSSAPACLPSGTRITPFLRDAVRHILAECPELLDDPFESGIRCLNAPASDVPRDPGNLITRLMHFIWLTRSDLQSAFDLSAAEGRRGFVDWFFSRAPKEFELADDFLNPVRTERENPSSAGMQEYPAAATEQLGQRITDTAVGVNLIGYVRAEMGLGEQARQCAAALSAVNVPLSINDFRFGLVASQRDTRYTGVIASDHPFQINLFHINAAQMSLVRNHLGLDFFRNHYNIGYWAWELSNFPDEWQDAIDLVDEIWAVSKFTQAAISKKTSKPVIWMPEAVEFPLPANADELRRTREKFGLPERAFLFLFAFDFSSSAARKNVQGCIEAFRAAFPEQSENAGLVIKTIRHPHHKREFWELLRAIGDDRRIILIDRVLRKDELHELIAACDSFISLHRSEGFGLGIAEAMYLGKPVIATNYSGNTDFTTKENSCLVDYELIPVKPGEYVLPEGQVWADPNLDEAAMYMRRLVADPDYGRRLGAAAADFIRQHHSFSAIGKRYAKRLEQIAAARDLLASPPE